MVLLHRKAAMANGHQPRKCGVRESATETILPLPSFIVYFMHFVYLIYNIKTKKFYIGETVDLNRRIKEHHSGFNISTKYQCIYWRTVYVEIYKSRIDAQAREKRLKFHGSGIVEIKKRIINSLELLDNKTGEGER